MSRYVCLGSDLSETLTLNSIPINISVLIIIGSIYISTALVVFNIFKTHTQCVNFLDIGVLMIPVI